MNKLKYLFILFLIFVLPSESFSQNGNNVKKILDELGNSARSYLLSATRPSYSVSAYTLGKNRINLNLNIVFSQGIFELPLSVTYGVSDKIDIFTDVSPITQTFNFDGDKINGFGDIVAGLRYRFHESKYFSHAVQSAVKIPTANKSKELGTGLIDFHLGIAEGFTYKKFSYDISAELDFLRRRDLPPLGLNAPPYIKHVIDSLKSVFNYKYETELVVSGGPGFDISDRVSVYTGLSFSRNFKLDYNTLQNYSGIGISLSDRTALGFSAMFGLKNSSAWGLSTGVSILF
ncbi:MAG: hypothetical protein EHM58_08615 [Ignavibacteriae bacterium]|nr:MAG: hypothetical protein EHM58_08615 [Ignavibacteriota bacterium]